MKATYRMIDFGREVCGKVTAFEGAVPLYLLCPEIGEGLSDRAEATPQHEWYRDYFLSIERYRGLDALDDNLYAGHFCAVLHPGESLTLVASTQATPSLDGASAYAERRAYEGQLVAQSGHADAPAWVQHLVLAADQLRQVLAGPYRPDALCQRKSSGRPTVACCG